MADVTTMPPPDKPPVRPPLELRLDRHLSNDVCTIGNLFADDDWQCFTLEDVVRPDGSAKVFGRTAIPPGRYRVVVSYSPHFARYLPELLNVPNFGGIRIHAGNTDADTEGCILVGNKVGIGSKSILNSRAAFTPLFERITDAITLENRAVWISVITNPGLKP